MKKAILKYKLHILGVIILVGIGYFVFTYRAQTQEANLDTANIATLPTLSLLPTEDVPHSQAELCKVGTFSTPTAQEVSFAKEIAQDRFVQYLRTAFNNWLSGKYGSATHPKTSYECEHTGLLEGVQCPDGAFDENEDNYDNGLSKISPDYLKSKFLVLTADGAPMGGESIIIIFKNRPDKVFYTWVYRYNNGTPDNENIIGFDFRAIDEYDLAKNEAPSIVETQKMFINQLCDEDSGI